MRYLWKPHSWRYLLLVIICSKTVLLIISSKTEFSRYLNRIKVLVNKASQPQALCTRQKGNRKIHLLEDDDNDYYYYYSSYFPSPVVEVKQSLVQVPLLLLPSKAGAVQVHFAF